jgi:hypothetical protein
MPKLRCRGSRRAHYSGTPPAKSGDGVERLLGRGQSIRRDQTREWAAPKARSLTWAAGVLSGDYDRITLRPR